MKFIATIMIVLASFGTCINVWADNQSKQAKIVELLEILDADAMATAMDQQIDAMMRNMEQEMGITADEKVVFDKHSSAMAATMREAVQWGKIDPVIKDIYARLFSEEELTDMIAFYKTKSGQAMLKKMPSATQRSFDLAQSMLEQSMPTIRESALALDKELKALRGQN